MALSHHVAIALAVALTPLAAAVIDIPGRSWSSSVVAHDAAYLDVTVFSPTLNLGNTYTANAINVIHSYTSAPTLDVTVTKKAGPSRYVLVSPTTASLGQNGGLTVQVQDSDLVHVPATDTIRLRIDATVKNPGRVGVFHVSRNVTVTVA